MPAPGKNGSATRLPTPSNAASEDPRHAAFRQTQIISSEIENLKQDEAEHAEKSNLEKLPAELRRQIYEYFCHENTCQITCRDAWRRDSPSPHPPLCVTSSQTRNEFLRLSEGLSTWIFEIADSTWPDILKWVKGTAGRPLHPAKIRFIWDGYIFEIKVLLHITIDLTPNCVGDRVELVDTWMPLPSESKNDELDKYMVKIETSCVCIAKDLYSQRKAGRLTSQHILDVANSIFTHGWKGAQIV